MTNKRTEQTTLRLRLICINPPVDPANAVSFGLQDKTEALHLGVAQADGSLAFQAEVNVKPRQLHTDPDFGGPVVHGPKAARFLYLSLRGPDDRWIKRIKIPLAAITWAQIGLAEQRGSGLTATISGHGSGSTKLLGDGWTVDAG